MESGYLEMTQARVSASVDAISTRRSENMAQELRHETLTAAVADGTTSSNSVAEFRNDSSRDIMIREIVYAHALATAANDENALVEIGKSPTQASLTNNQVFFNFPQQLNIAAGTIGSGADDVGTSRNGGKNWERGQLTLEPNESLFVNATKTSGGALRFRYVIGYEF